MKFLLFGTGDYYNRYKKWFEQQEVIALLDNALQKQHTYIDEIEVLSPKEGIELSYAMLNHLTITVFYVLHFPFVQLFLLHLNNNAVVVSVYSLLLVDANHKNDKFYSYLLQVIEVVVASVEGNQMGRYIFFNHM